MDITAAQLRAARALFNWNQQQLADASLVGLATIRRFEAGMSQAIGALQRRGLPQAIEAARVLFISEDRCGPGVRLRLTQAFEALVTTLVNLHGCNAPLDNVEVIAGHCSDEDRGALSLAFGDRVWGRENLPSDERGREIQDRLTRTGDFRA